MTPLTSTEEIMPIAFAYTLIVLLIITSALLTLLVLLHRGKGGGMSSMFGGGVSTSLAGSSVAEKNLDRYTVLVGIVWLACIIGLGLWLKVELGADTTPEALRAALPL
jgi:preprotein translocase subunit SecG